MILTAGLLPLGAWAAGEAPAVPSSGKVVLTVRGKIQGKTVDFDMQALEALGVTQIRTKTQWLTTPGEWSGVSLAKILAKVGASGSNLQVRALNDYSVAIPMSDVAKYDPILASKLDGKPLSVRDRGPLIVVYPYDSRPELNSQIFHDRAAWQVREIIVE